MPWPRKLAIYDTNAPLPPRAPGSFSWKIVFICFISLFIEQKKEAKRTRVKPCQAGWCGSAIDRSWICSTHLKARATLLLLFWWVHPMMGSPTYTHPHFLVPLFIESFLPSSYPRRLVSSRLRRCQGLDPLYGCLGVELTPNHRPKIRLPNPQILTLSLSTIQTYSFEYCKITINSTGL